MRQKTFLFLLFVGAVWCDMKTWKRNTNYDDPNNWNTGGVKCSNDIKKFPKDMRASVFIQKNESLQEILLSDNMVLTIEEGVVLTFISALPESEKSEVTPSVKPDVSSKVSQQTSTPPTENPARCKPEGRVVEFSASSGPWFDPKSWGTNQIHSNDSLRFLLDVEKVPCSQDRVIFPDYNSFVVDMEAKQLNIGSMLIHNEEMITQYGFDLYWSQQKAPYEFVNRPSDVSKDLTITGLPCGDDRSCQCDDRYSESMKSSVCSHVTCADITSLCVQPLPAPPGHCCSMCGATLTVNTNSTKSQFPLNELHHVITGALQGVSGNVKYTLGRIMDSSNVDIILIDGSGSGEDASKSVCKIREALLKNETTQVLDLDSVLFNRSDGVDNCNPPKAPSTPSSQVKKPVDWDTIIIGVSVGFGVICLMFVLLGVFLYRRKYMGSGKNEMELARVRTSQGFDNPVYDTPYDDNFVVSYDHSQDEVSGFDNALYTPTSETGDISKLPEKKLPPPMEDPYAPVVKKTKKSKKKQKEAQDMGFDNPVYNLKPNGTGEGTDSMVSVSLDEEEAGLPGYVEHDGTGFVNPIATGLTEEQMAPALSQKVSKGFENPLFAGRDDKVGGLEDVAEVSVHVSSKPAKKKKSKRSKKSGASDGSGGATAEVGFGNPLYGQDEEPENFYQPESPGDDDNGPVPEA